MEKIDLDVLNITDVHIKHVNIISDHWNRVFALRGDIEVTQNKELRLRENLILSEFNGCLFAINSIEDIYEIRDMFVKLCSAIDQIKTE